MSYAQELIPGGVAYVFHHHELGLLGHIVVQEITGIQRLVSLEVAGDPEDFATDHRIAVLEPVAKELAWRLELHGGRIEAMQGMVPPFAPPDASEMPDLFV